MTNEITFEKATIAHKEIIFSWLAEPHVQEFWDNTQEHKDNIINFMSCRKELSNYCEGKYVYWIALASGTPYAMLMKIRQTIKDDIADLKLSHLSKTGNTYGLDYMIGNKDYIGKGYGTNTLIEFVDFFRDAFDKKADTFLIDLTSDNPRAKRVYEKAGFKHIADFVMCDDCSGASKLHHLLIKKFEPKISVIKATMDDYQRIQNMARFYVYDLSRECGAISSDWAIPEDGLYESFDFKNYFEESSRKAYLIKVYDEIAGFVLLNQATENPANKWNIGEFFVISKFQGQGIASRVAYKIWKMNPGTWEVSVIPENKIGLAFWEKTISKFTGGTFKKQIKKVTYDEDQPRRIIFEFETQNCNKQSATLKIDLHYSNSSDINGMISLSKAKRLAYEKAQSQFWKYAGEEGDRTQATWFTELLSKEDYIILSATYDNQLLGFVIGRIIPAPEVYDPGGLTLMIDDFCVQNDNWEEIGTGLIDEIKQLAKDKGASQILVVCGAHDYHKRKFLINQNLSIASEWFVGRIV